MIQILLVDDQKLIRQGLKALLELDPNIQVVGSVSNGESAIEQVEALKPDIVLIDVRMPGMDGVTATQIISKRFPDTKVIILSGYDDEEYLADALRSGAKGYLLKDTPAEELISVIQAVYKGYSQIGPGLLEKINSRIPDLHKINSVSVSPQTTAFKSLKLEVERQLKNFEPKTLPELVHLAVEQKAVIELLAYVNSLLQPNQDNLAALYLAGALSFHTGAEDRTQGLQYLKLGFYEGINQRLSREDILLFYFEGVKHNAIEAFSWLTRIDTPWNNESGLFFLLDEASRLFGTTSRQYRTLLLLLQIRAMRSFSDKCATLSGKLEFLERSLENANSLKT